MIKSYYLDNIINKEVFGSNDILQPFTYLTVIKYVTFLLHYLVICSTYLTDNINAYKTINLKLHNQIMLININNSSENNIQLEERRMKLARLLKKDREQYEVLSLY